MHLERNSNNPTTERRQPSPRSRPSGYGMWLPILLWAALAVSLPSSVQGQLTLDRQICIDKLVENDRNNDGRVTKVEFANFLVRASPYGISCPDLSEVGDFLEGGKYYALLEASSCACLQYDTDPSCCDVPSIQLSPPYPDEYLTKVCTDVGEAVTQACTPTGSPTIPPPTSSPVANIESRPTATPTLVPTSSPPTSAPTSSPTSSPTKSPSADNSTGEDNLDLPKFSDGKDTALEEFADYFERPWPLWLLIMMPFVGVTLIVCCVGCCLLLVDCHRRRRKKQHERQIISKGVMFESDDEGDSLAGYPDILEETDVDDTERSMEEGKITEQKSRTASASNKKKKKKKTDSKAPQSEENLPPPKSPQRMSKFLDSLDLESTAGPSSSDPRSADSVSRVDEIVEAVADQKQSAKGQAPRPRAAPAKADSRGRMGHFFKSSSSDASASSAELFTDDQEDDASEGTGTTESNSQIKWKLLHPTTLVNTGAVEVFPLPPAVTGYVSSSSSSPFDSGGESKEAHEDDDDDEDESVSDVYVAEDTNASHPRTGDYYGQSQPDPDGMRLEDGRQYREQWTANR